MPLRQSGTPCSRWPRLDGPNGAFAGMAVAMLDAEPLRELYRSIDVGQHGMIESCIRRSRMFANRRAPIRGEPAQSDPIFLAQRSNRLAAPARPLARGGPSYLSATAR